jgi:hypothetical protein
MAAVTGWRKSLFLPASLLAAVASTDAASQQASIVGTWEWTRKVNNCSEQYVFRDSGTLSVKSGDDRTESTYLMTWTPEPNGRYKLTITTVEDSGGQGCMDSTNARVDGGRIVYVLFGASRETMILCNSPAGADCIGPLKKSAR